MAASERLITSVPKDQREIFTAMAEAQGVSVSHLLSRLVHKAVAEEPLRIQRLEGAAFSDKAPAQKYTVRLLGMDAATLERRAEVRRVTPSGYVAHVLRAHLRASPSMPYREFQDLKRVVDELRAIRLSLQQLIDTPTALKSMELSLRDNVVRLLPALKEIRQRIQDTLTANAKSWEAPHA